MPREDNNVDKTIAFIVASITDSALQSRVRLTERFVLRIRRSKDVTAKQWALTKVENRPVVLDLCEPGVARKKRGPMTLITSTKDADPLQVLWSFGAGQLSDDSMSDLRAACARLGWVVDDALLRHS